MVAPFLNSYDMTLAQINTNRWRTLLNLVVVSRELGYELEEGELHTMYCIKRNRVDKGKMYISVITL